MNWRQIVVDVIGVAGLAAAGVGMWRVRPELALTVIGFVMFAAATFARPRP